jgi:transcriptional regulator with XRE-family HTH domain
MKLGLPQRAFAQRIEVTRNVVIRWEGEHNRPRPETLDRIAKVGGVSVGWLLDGGRRERAPTGVVDLRKGRNSIQPTAGRTKPVASAG